MLTQIMLEGMNDLPVASEIFSIISHTAAQVAGKLGTPATFPRCRLRMRQEERKGSRTRMEAGPPCALRL